MIFMIGKNQQYDTKINAWRNQSDSIIFIQCK